MTDKQPKLYTLTAPGGKFTVDVQGEERRDVFLKRGYTLPGKSASPGPETKRAKAT